MKSITSAYAELHCHSNYSFQEGASSIDDLALRASRLGYAALALTDHDNLCGAMEYGQTAKVLGLKAITGAEVTLSDNHHLTLLAATPTGYANLSRLLSYVRIGPAPLPDGEKRDLRREPLLDAQLLPAHAEGLIALSGCRSGEVPSLIAEGRVQEAEEACRWYLEWFGSENFYLELQHNLVYGDDERIRGLIALGKKLGVPVVATNNVHYHVRSRHRLQDALVAIKARKTLEESHRERRANSEFFLKSPAAMVGLFGECPSAIENTLVIAERCGFDVARDIDYRFPDYPVPEGFDPDSYLRHICYEAARRRYGTFGGRVSANVHQRLQDELRLIKKHGLAGFLLIYHDVIEIAREVMRDLGLCPPQTPLEDCLPGRGRGSSVAMLTGYLIGLSHIDPLEYKLSLDRFLPEELGTTNEEGKLGYTPDIDLDFPRNIREELIRRVHAKWGWDHAALSGMIDTYQTKGAVRDLGKVLGLPSDEIDKLAKRVEGRRASGLKAEMETMPDFRDKVTQPGWRDMVALAAELDGFPRHLAQHPGGMIISSKPLIDLVPIQPGAIEGRYVCQWDKDSIDDAGFVKIDFLSLGALSQMQDALKLIEERRGECVDLTRINFEDEQVYDSLCTADTIGIFQVESAAQMQTIVRLRPRNLTDMAYEVGAVRPGVGANHGVAVFLARRLGQQPVTYDHPLEEKALERTLGVILFQDQVNQLAMDVAGFSASEADQLRRAFTRRRNKRLIAACWERFREGAAKKGVSLETARKVFKKFNGEYMFPESHAFAFGVTAYHTSWLKYYYPLEFYVGLFNQQPMGFYNIETLKEDARRHGVTVLNPDINRSREKSTALGDDLLVGIENVIGIGEKLAKTLVAERDAHGVFRSLADFMERTGLPQRSVEDFIEAGAFDGLLGAQASCLPEALPETLAFLPKTHVYVESGGRGGYEEGPVPSVFPYGNTPSPPIPFPDGPRPDPVGRGLVPRLPAPAGHKDPPYDIADRRRGLQEAALRYHPSTGSGNRVRSKHGYQLTLPFPVDQDLLDVPPQPEWDRMEGEYRTMGLFPTGHVMAYLRRHLAESIIPSNMMDRFPEGATVTTAGLIIRRQHPLAKAIFLTLEDEFGHIPVIVWLDVYQRHKLQFKDPFVIVTGQVSRRDGTFNIIAQKAETFRGNAKPPKAKSWS